MRVRNPKRATRQHNRCNCEHQNHFTDRYEMGRSWKVPRIKHPYMRRAQGNAWALYVGHVCDDCAATCMEGWIVPNHVCGTGDCHRD